MTSAITIAIGVVFLGLLGVVVLRSMRKSGSRGMTLEQRSSEDSAVPPWAEFFKAPHDVEAFQTVVVGYFESRGQRVAIEDGRVHPIGGTNSTWKYGLTSVGQQCAAAPRSRWPSIVATHFDAMKRSEAQDRELEAEVENFDAIRPRLVLRLWDKEIIESSPIEGVTREDIPGLLTVLCIDLPDSIKSVHPDVAQKWGRDSDELFAVARENVRGMCRPEVEETDLGDFTLRIIEDESPYTAGLALDLDRFPGIEGPHGAFVGIPIRNAIVSLRWSEPKDFTHVHGLMQIVTGMERDGPGAVSARVYWYRRGRWTEIPFEVGEEGVAVRPPPEFIEYLQSVALTDS